MGFLSKLTGKTDTSAVRAKQQFRPMVMWNGQVMAVPVQTGPSRSDLDRLERKSQFRQNREREYAADRQLQQHLQSHGRQSLQLKAPHELTDNDVLFLPAISSPRRVPQGGNELADFQWVGQHLSGLLPPEWFEATYNSIVLAGKAADTQAVSAGGKKTSTDTRNLAFVQAADARMHEANKTLAKYDVLLRVTSSHYDIDQDGDHAYALHIEFPTTTTEAAHWRDHLLPQWRQQYGLNNS